MLRVTLVVGAAAFLVLTANAAAAPPAWFGEGTAFITAADPQANCAPDAAGRVSCGLGSVIHDGVAMRGGCGGSDSSGYECKFDVSHDVKFGGVPQHHCVRTTQPAAKKERAWFWDIEQPPKPYETAELATLAECVAKQQGDSQAETRAGFLRFFTRGSGLGLYGAAGSNAGTFPRRLSVTLPKGVAFAPARSCRRAVARALTLASRRCSDLIAGRLNDPKHTGWVAFAGPMQQGGRRKVWLRARHGNHWVGFGTGTVLPASGRYGQKLVAPLGQLGLNTTLIELFAEHLRSTRPCGRGLRYRIQLVNDAGTINTRKTARCDGGGSGHSSR
jgi:hypothetical protein